MEFSIQNLFTLIKTLKWRHEFWKISQTRRNLVQSDSCQNSFLNLPFQSLQLEFRWVANGNDTNLQLPARSRLHINQKPMPWGRQESVTSWALLKRMKQTFPSIPLIITFEMHTYRLESIIIQANRDKFTLDCLFFS